MRMNRALVFSAAALLLVGEACATTSPTPADTSASSGVGSNASSGGHGSTSESTSSAPGGSSSTGSGIGSSSVTGSAGGDGGGSPDGAGGGNGACPANAIFCADFESGSIPSEAVFFPAYQQSMASTYVTIDSTVAHSGKDSVKFLNVANPSSSSMLVVKTNTPTFWSRVYIRQDIDTATVTAHDSFFGATTGSGDANDGSLVRVGEHSCQLEINKLPGDTEILSDTTGPDGGAGNYVCSGGIAFTANTWYCVETFFDGPNSTVHVYVDGMDTTLVATNWGPFTFDAFKFGFELSGPLRNVWYDDIVLAPQRVGCQ